MSRPARIFAQNDLGRDLGRFGTRTFKLGH
jgi:hypothetical protein